MTPAFLAQAGHCFGQLAVSFGYGPSPYPDEDLYAGAVAQTAANASGGGLEAIAPTTAVLTIVALSSASGVGVDSTTATRFDELEPTTCDITQETS